MSTVPDEELQHNLDSILTRAQSERIVISRRGKACAVLVGIEDYDAEDLELASSEDFCAHDPAPASHWQISSTRGR